MKVSKIALQIRDRIPISSIHAEDYVSTDNMRPNFGGIEVSSSLPPSGNVTAYQAGDILLSNIRPYFRKTWFATHSGGCNADVLCIRADPEKCIPQYLYYLLTTDNFVEDYLKSCKGAKMPRGNIQRLLDYEFNLPDLPTQLRIAAILGSIDEKIELNRKKIAELEALAKTIYDYWFIQFDFPDKNGKPYKSSGGKMIWNEQLKREIPEGWEEWSIHKSGSFHRGISYSKQDEITKGLNSVSVYRGNNISNGFVVDDSNEVFIPKNMVAESHMLQRGQVLIAMSSGSKEHVGKTGLVTNTCPNCAFGAFCTAFEPIDEYKFLIYDFFRSSTYRAYINQICSGTGINNLKFEHFETALFAVPGDQEILKSFNAIQEPLYNQIMRLDEESSILKNTRNYLLPLLMNGQVEVKE